MFYSEKMKLWRILILCNLLSEISCHFIFGEWNSWSGCSYECGGGIQSRYRNCEGCGDSDPQHFHEECVLMESSELQNDKNNIIECGTLLTITNRKMILE